MRVLLVAGTPLCEVDLLKIKFLSPSLPNLRVRTEQKDGTDGAAHVFKIHGIYNVKDDDNQKSNQKSLGPVDSITCQLTRAVVIVVDE